MINLKSKIKSIPGWPIESVIFRDTPSLFMDPEAAAAAHDVFFDRYKDQNINKIVAIDARGFLFGSVLAYRLNKPLVLVRKKGKIPPETIQESYSLEYGKNTVEISKDGIDEGDKVLVMDDLIATGGTIAAAVKLVERLGGKVAELAFLVELPDLKGRDQLKGYPIFALIEFEGE